MKFVTVYRAFNEVEAKMVKEFLDDQGIHTKISSQLPSAVYGFTNQEIKVQVDEQNEDLALELVEAYFSDQAEVHYPKQDSVD